MDEMDIQKLRSVFDMVYVKKDDCSERHKVTEQEINEIKIQIAENTAKLNLILKIGTAAAVGAVGSFATALCSLILK